MTIDHDLRQASLAEFMMGGDEEMEDSIDGTVEPVEAHLDIDLSYLGLELVPLHYCEPSSSYNPCWVKSLILHHNAFTVLQDPDLAPFVNLAALDVSANQLTELPSSITGLTKLRIIIAKNNFLDSGSFPKQFSRLTSLEVVNFSGNQLTDFPLCTMDLPSLKAMYLGGNMLQTLPCRIGDIQTLEVLYLGGNQLSEIPATIGRLRNLSSLVLCDNQLETIPSTIAECQKLQSLSLHKNKLKVLPPEIVFLREMRELSLRGNPLVVRFAKDINYDPPSLKELAGRALKLNRIQVTPDDVPGSLHSYLDSAHECVNPKCKGVYFEARVEHVKFVDFCGKYRVPLMQYLCSPTCSSAPAYAMTSESSGGESDTEDELPPGVLNRVLLG